MKTWGVHFILLRFESDPMQTVKYKMQMVFNVHRYQRLVTHTLDDTDFGVKVDFCGGRKTGLRTRRKTPRSQIEINQSQPAHEPRIELRPQCWEGTI